MFIEFTTKEGTKVILNTRMVVSVEQPPPLSGIQGGGQMMRLYCLEGRVYTLDKKDYDVIRDQIEIEELSKNGQDKSSPVG